MAAVKQKKRGQVNRSRTKLILIAAEGRNKTEKLYFHELFQNNKDYRVRFTSSTETDPVGIVASAVQYIRSEELDLKNGDLAFCTIDTDTDISKQGQINQARKLAEKNGVELLISNPCFEVWFLQHFRYSTKSYASNDEVIRDLTTYYSGLQKERKCLRFDRTCTGACGKTSETAGAAPCGARPKEKQYGMQSKHGCVQSP